MKLLIIFSLTIYSFSIYSQKAFFGTNYFFTLQKNIYHQGAFFLYTKGSHIYLITAGHAITGWNAFSNKQEDNIPDTIQFRFPTQNGSIILKANLKEIKHKISKGRFYEKPDLFFAEINALPLIVINSINEFLPSSYVNVHPIKYFIYGFPSDKSLNNFDSIVHKEPKRTEGIPMGDYHSPVKYPKIMKLDSINYLIKTDKNVDRGFSGSPVFFKDVSGKIFFGGMCIGGIPGKQATILRPDEIFRQIENNKHPFMIKLFIK